MAYKIKNKRGGDTWVLTHEEQKEAMERKKPSKKITSNGERIKYKASGGRATHGYGKAYMKGGKVK